VKKFILLSLILFIFSFSFVAATPLKALEGNFDNGLSIEYPNFNTFKQGVDSNLTFSIFNNSNGAFITDSLLCSFKLYNKTGYQLAKIESTTVSNDFDIDIKLDKGNFSNRGEHFYSFKCNTTIGTGGFIAVPFEVTLDGVTRNPNPIVPAIIILLPLLFSFLLIAAVKSLDPEEHNALRLFLFLFSIVPFFASLNLGMIALIKYYNFTAMENLIGSITWWSGMFLFMLFFYFMIYIFIIATHQAAQKKEAKLKY